MALPGCDGSMMGDGHDPRSSACLAGLEPRRVAPHTEQRLLDHVLGKHRVIRDSERESVHGSLVSVVQPGDAPLVTAGDSAQEILVRSRC
jgi:hypothetical protein